MEKVKQVAAPTKFVSMRVKLSTVDFVRFEAELEHSSQIETSIKSLNDQSIKIGGFTQPFKTKAKKASTDFPTKQQWESHFMENAEHYDENKPGERPDTVLFKDVPKRFFSEEASLIPTEDNVRLAFLTFGQIRHIDIPMLSGEEDSLLSGAGLVAGGLPGEEFNAFSLTGTGLNFDFYVQFIDRIGFERCMDEFRDMKLMHIDDTGKAVAAAVKIQFDKSKHLSEAKILQRQESRKQAEIEAKRKEAERQRKREEAEAKEAEKERVRQAKNKEHEERRLKRQAKRREKHLKKKHESEERRLKKRIQIEERKLLLAQRKLEATRILEKLFDRVAKMKEAELAKKLEAELEAERQRKLDKLKRQKEKEEAELMEKKKKEEARLEKKEQAMKEALLKQIGDKRRVKEAERLAKEKGEEPIAKAKISSQESRESRESRSERSGRDKASRQESRESNSRDKPRSQESRDRRDRDRERESSGKDRRRERDPRDRDEEIIREKRRRMAEEDRRDRDRADDRRRDVRERR